MGKRIIRIDASSIKDSHCFRKIWLQVVEGYKEQGLSSDVHYGSCFHLNVEVTEQTGNIVQGVMAAQQLWSDKVAELYVKKNKQHLTAAHLMQACKMYGEERLCNSIFTDVEYLTNPVDPTKKLLEQKMSVPLYEDDNLLILLQGTIDGLVKLRNGCICIADWKTTSSWDKDAYFEGYKMSPQLKTYLYGLHYYRDNYPNSPIGRLLRSSPGEIGAFIYGGFHSATKIMEFARSDIFWFTEAQMDEYTEKLNDLVDRIVAHVGLHKDGSLPIAEGSFNGSCILYGNNRCKYFSACSAEVQMNSSPAMVRHVLDTKYEKREYRPLEFGGGHNKTNTTTTIQTNEENIITT